MAIAQKFLGAAVSVLSLASAAAYADSAPNVGTTVAGGSPASVVRFSDLNLNQPRDVARLVNRISAAANNVCGPRSFGGFFPTADYKACYSDAVARAVARIDRPLVSAYFQQNGADSVSRKLTFFP